MKQSCLFACLTAVFAVACGSDKSAASGAETADTAAAVVASAAAAAVAVDSAVAPAPTSAPKREPTSAVSSVTQAKGAAPAAKTTAVPAVQAVPTPTPAARPADAAPVVAVTPSAPPADPMSGQPSYQANCQRCHGAAGVPSKTMQLRFEQLAAFDAAFFRGRSHDSVMAVLQNGTSVRMKSYSGKLTHQEMVSVAAYIRTLAR